MEVHYPLIINIVHNKRRKFVYLILFLNNDKITTKAANFMKTNYPEVKGFTKRNIERMIQFYKTYKNDEIATTRYSSPIKVKSFPTSKIKSFRFFTIAFFKSLSVYSFGKSKNSKL